jgi:HAD superfamily phosphoserine phosphatase-like hydrolase
MWRPSDDQVGLFLGRDGLEVHRIEEDNEWEACLDCLKSAWLELPRSKAKPHRGRGGANPLSLAKTERQITINGYKLFYYRDIRSISRDSLSKRTGIPSRRIRYLEGVNKNKDLGPECFKSCWVAELQGLEKALKPDTSLEYGKTDDFLAYYIEYYKNNWRTPRAKTAPQQDSLFSGRARAVVFDFGGTLTIPQFKESTWERIWKSVGFTLEEANELHHRFSAGKINHQEWCDLTCRKLRDAGFSISHFERVYSDIKPIDGLKETFEELRKRRIAIHIVSGSLRTIIEKVLDGSARYVDSIRSNDMEFDSMGLLKKISGHSYDFEGKARFIQLVAKELDCHPIDILFVGNSLNDEKAATSGARTLCVNPKHTHYYVQSMWNNTIREMSNLKEILRFV